MHYSRLVSDPLPKRASYLTPKITQRKPRSDTPTPVRYSCGTRGSLSVAKNNAKSPSKNTKSQTQQACFQKRSEQLVDRQVDRYMIVRHQASCAESLRTIKNWQSLREDLETVCLCRLCQADGTRLTKMVTAWQHHCIPPLIESSEVVNVGIDIGILSLRLIVSHTKRLVAYRELNSLLTHQSARPRPLEYASQSIVTSP
jgi:hypothetical protein